MKIGSYIIVGEGEGDRYLDKVLNKLYPLVDFIYIWGDNVDKKTAKLCNSYDKVIFYNHDKSLWKDRQWQIKRTVVKDKLSEYNPDWVIALDADEVLDYRLNREKLEELATKDETIAYEFYCVQLWGDEKHMRVDGGWGNFQNVRFFEYLPESGFDWRRTRVHCGLAPLYAYRWRGTSGYMFKHYGYMKEKDRPKKIERYEKLDPKNQFMNKGWYDSIDSKPEIREFNEEEFAKRLKYRKKIPKLKLDNKMAKTYIVKNKYGKHYRVSEDRLEEHINREGIELVDEEPIDNNPEPPKPEKDENMCDICGFVAKSKAGLSAHKRAKH